MLTVLADAGPTVGLGHVSRAGAVAAALRVQGHDVATYVAGDDAVTHDGVDWSALGDGPAPGGGPLLLDSYRVAPPPGRPVATFWDGVGERPPVDLALVLADDPSLACLRPQFWGVAARPVGEVRRVLVTAGGGAVGGVGALAAAVHAALPGIEVAAVLGPYATETLPPGITEVRAPARMADALRAADVVVSAAGQTMLEALCCGTPCVAFAAVDNQRAQLAAIERRGAVHATALDAAPAAVAALAADLPAREALATTGRATIDGFGALRVAGLLARLAETAGVREPQRDLTRRPTPG